VKGGGSAILRERSQKVQSLYKSSIKVKMLQEERRRMVSEGITKVRLNMNSVCARGGKREGPGKRQEGSRTNGRELSNGEERGQSTSDHQTLKKGRLNERGLRNLSTLYKTSW